MNRIAEVQWLEVKLEAPKTVTLTEGDKTPGESEDEYLRRLFRIHPMDPRPVFLYFHYGHEKDPKSKAPVSAAGKASEKQCGVMADAKFIRWGPLVRCIEVDMDRSDARIAQRVGLGDGASYAFVNEKLSAVAKAEDFADGAAAAAFIEKAIKTHYADYWKTLEERIAEQKVTLAAAKELEKQKKLDEALDKYREIVNSDLRIADFWEDTYKDAEKLAAKLKSGK